MLLFSNCIVATSSFHYEGGVRYQGEYILHIGISVLLLFSNCIVATSSFHYEGGVRYQGEYILHIGISVLLLFSNCIVVRFCFTIITKVGIFFKYCDFVDYYLIDD